MFAVSIIFFVYIFYICYILISRAADKFEFLKHDYVNNMTSAFIFLINLFWEIIVVYQFLQIVIKKWQFAALNHFFINFWPKKLFARFKILLSQQLFCKLLLWTMFSKLLFRIIFCCKFCKVITTPSFCKICKLLFWSGVMSRVEAVRVIIVAKVVRWLGQSG